MELQFLYKWIRILDRKSYHDIFLEVFNNDYDGLFEHC